MRTGAVVDYLILRVRERLHIHLRIRTAVHHEGHVEIGEIAAVPDHLDLTADAFLGRGSVDRDGIGLVQVCFFQCLRRSEDGWTLQMMTAGVSEAWKRVILTEQSDVRAAVSVVIDGLKCSRDTRGAGFDLEAFAHKPLCQNVKGMKLLHADFRVIEDIVGHRDHLFPNAIDRLK